MKHKKILAALLSLAMVAGSLPAAVIADETTSEETVETETVETEAEEKTADEELAADEAPSEEVPDVSEEVISSPAPSYDADYSYEHTKHVTGSFEELDSNGFYELEDNTLYIVEDNIFTEGRLHVGGGKNVVIDLQGYTIDRGLSEESSGRDSVFGVEAGATLTVINGAVTGGYRDGNGGGFNVNGNLILDGVTVVNNRCVEAGGGIYARKTPSADESASVTLMGNCVISDNTAGTNGDGIYIGDDASLNIQDAPVVADNAKTNVYLDHGRKINVINTLSTDANIGITHVDEGYSDFTVGFAGYNGGNDPNKIFFGDGSNVIVWADNDEVRSGYEYVKLEWDSESKELIEERITLTSFYTFDRLDLTNDNIVLNDGNWYVLNSNKTYYEAKVICSGNVNIVLCEGRTLTCLHGIVVDEGNTLNIYGQENNTGAIVATGGSESAGIGSGNETGSISGAINIHGGNITATGDEFGAGIGGGDGSGANVTIYGGTVTATGGRTAPGIGSGQGQKNLGTIRIWGGTVNTTGGFNGAGIGGSGSYPYKTSALKSGTIEIGGGTVNATGTNLGAGIGGGESANVTIDIIISGGTVTATAGTVNLCGAPGIGGGGYGGAGGTFSGTITISGGTVTARGGNQGAGIGGAYTSDLEGTVTISGGTVEAIGVVGGAAIGGGSSSDYGTGSITGQLTGTLKIDGGTVILKRDGDINTPCAMIGKGSGNVASIEGTIKLSPDLCVHYDFSDPVLSEERVSTCRYESTDTSLVLNIEKCSHQRGITYTTDEDFHTAHCSFCNSQFTTEEHSFENGTCTVCGYIQNDGIGVRLAGYSLSLSSDIGVNFYMELADDVAASSEAYVLFTLPDNSTHKVYVKRQSDAGLSYADLGSIDNKEYYVFKCSVPAKYIAQSVKAQIIDGDRTGIEYSFTVREYAEYLIANPTDPEFAGAQDLARALLNYGAFAQEYFGVQSDLKPDRPATSVITIGDEYKYDASNTDFDERYGTFAGVSLSLESKTTLSFYIKTTRTIDSCVAELYDESQQYDCEVVSSGQYQIVRVNGIAAKDLNKTVMLYLTLDDEPFHIGYCPLTYCYTVVNGGYSTNLQDVCKALYYFHVEALKYSRMH